MRIILGGLAGLRRAWPLWAGGGVLVLLTPFLPDDLPRIGLWLLFSGLAAAAGYLRELLRGEAASPGAAKEAAEEAVRWRKAYEALFREKCTLLERVEELSTLREVALTITSILEFRPMVETILDVTSAALEGSGVCLYLSPGEEKGRLEPVAGRIREKGEGSQEGSGIPMGPEEISRARERVGSLSWERLSGSASLFVQDGPVGRLYVPLVGRGECLGAIELLRAGEDPPFTEKDRARAATLAGTIAVALTNARLYEMAVTDGLTGLYVHRHFQHRLDSEVRRAARTNRPLSLLLTDIDHFKSFNDENGHQTGDKVLAGVAEILRTCARAIDVVARYGGEEMALILPETDAAGAALLAERIRASVEGQEFTGEKGESLHVTISIGVATLARNESRRDLIRRSDEALYAAKNAGRNRVESAPLKGNIRKTG